MLDFSILHSAVNGILDLGMTKHARILHQSDDIVLTYLRNFIPVESHSLKSQLYHITKLVVASRTLHHNL